MESKDLVLVTMIIGLVLSSGAMLVMHPDREWPEDEKVVTLLTPAPPTYTKIYKEAVRRFEKKYEKEGYRVRYIHVPYGAYYRKVQFMEVAKMQADVIYMDQAQFPNFEPKGMLEDLQPWIDGDPEFDTEPFVPMAMREVRFEGKQLGMPLLWSPALVFYNKKAFREAGIEFDPSQGWDYDQFLEIAKKLTKRKAGTARVERFGIVNVTGSWYSFVWREGGRVFSEDMQRCTMDTPEAIRALQFIQDLIHKHKVAPTSADQASQQDREMFKTGRAAMIIDTRFSRASYKEITAFGWDVAPIPRSKAGLTTTTLIVDSISLARNGKNKELGWKLMKFLTSEEMMKVYADVGTGLPSRSKSAREAVDPTQPGDRLFLNVPKDCRYLFRPTTAPKEVAAAFERLQAVWADRETPEAVVKEMVRLVELGRKKAKERSERFK